MDVRPSGKQLEIVYGDQHATVVEVGGGIRQYRVGDRRVLDPYPIDAMCDGAHGAPLIPWPGRLADGRYRFDGVDYQVALSEPATHNAIHGLLRWRSWQVLRHSQSRVTMGTWLFPNPGYPFLLDVEVDYVLSGEGLSVATTTVNNGDCPCPYGAGQHPYLSPGPPGPDGHEPGHGLVDDCTVALEAATRIVVDDRRLPVGTEAVEGGAYNFGQARLLGAQRLDFAFTDLARDSDGRAWARLGGPDGRHAELWVDESYPIIEMYTGDTLAPDRRRTGLAVEPMTCPPNAFASGDGLIRLEPGRSVTTNWGARLT